MYDPVSYMRGAAKAADQHNDPALARLFGQVADIWQGHVAVNDDAFWQEVLGTSMGAAAIGLARQFEPFEVTVVESASGYSAGMKPYEFMVEAADEAAAYGFDDLRELFLGFAEEWGPQTDHYALGIGRPALNWRTVKMSRHGRAAVALAEKTLGREGGDDGPAA